LKNLKKGRSYYNKTIFEIRLTIYNLIYQAVRNIRHILSNYINNQCILSQIVNANLLNILTISVFSFIPKLNLIISVMNIVYWMIAKFGVWTFLSINKQITFEYIFFFKHNLYFETYPPYYSTIKCYNTQRSPKVGKKHSNIKNIWVIVIDILVHVSTVLENMKKGTSYNNKTYFEFKLTIYSC
jgi:hypothetical protein